jgi:hypothetical protein
MPWEQHMNRRFDVCNGDADGLCSVIQWRLAEPAEATLVTGLKRDIELLQQVPAGAGDEVLVCDLSMRRNRDALLRLLQAGARVRYFDHHEPGEIPDHPALQACIDVGSEVCASVLVDRHLQGRWRAWAVVGAYGDNLDHTARQLAESIGMDDDACARLRDLGRVINYNAYGERPEDVHIVPERLYTIMARHRDPLELLAREPVCAELLALQQADLRRARELRTYHEAAGGSVYLLPDAAWSRRVKGSFANELASAERERAHAVLVPTGTGGLSISVRAPLEAPGGANALCQRFGGAGRAKAAGIDRLPPEDVERFVAAFAAAQWGGVGVNP